MFKRLRLLVTSLALLGATPLMALSPSADLEPAAKLSSRNICHEKGSQSYQQTKRFTPFDSLEDCLKQGRLPGSNAASAKAEAKPQPSAKTAPRYDRDAFGGWSDEDGNCMNTRHEVLKALSTSTVQMKNRCSVERGRWLDPYTGKIFTKAQDLDIDHLVPLAYAWERGADQWDKAKRIRFANDPANLFAVDRATNREKGAQGPNNWLPPEAGFHCQYILRFQRVAQTYGLELPAGEKQKIETLRQKLCA